MKVEIKYLVYDGRYAIDWWRDRALVMTVEDSLEKARKIAPDYGDDCVIVKTKIVDGIAQAKDDEVVQ